MTPMRSVRGAISLSTSPHLAAKPYSQRALLDVDIASFDPPEILQALAERRHAELAFGVFLCQPRN